MAPKRKRKSKLSFLRESPLIMEAMSQEDPALLARMPEMEKAVKEFQRKKAQQQQSQTSTSALREKSNETTDGKMYRLFKRSPAASKVKAEKKLLRMKRIKRPSNQVENIIVSNATVVVNDPNIPGPSQPSNNSEQTGCNHKQQPLSDHEEDTPADYEAQGDNFLQETEEHLEELEEEEEESVSICHVKIKINPSSAYELAIRKAKAIMPLDDHFLSVIMPDFDVIKSSLKKRKFVVIRRKCVFGDGGGIRWLFGCSCNLFEQDFINSLSPDTDYIQKENETCIHIMVGKTLIEELDSWQEDEDPFDFESADLSEQVDEVTDITFPSEHLLVVVEGTPGVISFDGFRFFCCICENSYCIHCGFMKKKKAQTEQPDLLSDFFKKMHVTRTSSKTKSSLSWKLVSFEVTDTTTVQAPQSYLTETDGRYLCADTDNCCRFCNGVVEARSKRDVVLYCKNYSFNCKGKVKTETPVLDKQCTECGKNLPYDGLGDSILNMGMYLVHHNVLRDYMLHFLHGNSCTIFGYYQVMAKSQENSGNATFRKSFSYNDLRCAWYAFLRLLDTSFEDAASCKTCGTIPDVVVCDATSLGHQKKFLALGLADSREESIIPRYSIHKDRVAIDQKKLREQIKKWSEGKVSKQSSKILLGEVRAKYRCVYNVMKWSVDVFGEAPEFPRSLRNIFQMISSPSPVCSYVEPTEEVFGLLLKLLDPNIKADGTVMRAIHDKLPAFHELLASLSIEDRLPEEWKGLLLHLTEKSAQPFNAAYQLEPESCETSSDFSSFPNLPPLRKRGVYAQDKVAVKNKDCRKNYNGHPNLTSGIFTVYCSHGICFGFQVMDKEESPNTPFTIFKTRFPKAPKMIIYDNACSLHNYALNRDPVYFQHTKFLVDRFHWKNHTACSLGYCMNKYPSLKHINSEVNEQQNAATKKLKTQLSYMTPENFMSHCKLFFWYRNQLSQK